MLGARYARPSRARLSWSTWFGSCPAIARASSSPVRARRARRSARGAWRHSSIDRTAPRSAAAARHLARLDELDARVVGRAQEGDAPAIGELDGSLEELGAQALEPADIALDLRGVEAEVLEAEVGRGVSRSELLSRARAGDVHRHAPVHALAADEAVAEDARLVVDDLEVEGRAGPLGRAARVGCLQVNVVDAKGHGCLRRVVVQFDAAVRLCRR